ncbi:MAG TPA: phosphoribosylaminoimidazolesuccinocarboxamide synthase [Gemmatimonadaceae bacterium]|nr:phosphoribosylaminoimidazolesuccinocarboxamide synthase [Gemmatimonadaceae bacterium]
MTVMTSSALPLRQLGRGKVRDIYEVDADRLLLVATDRVSAFDVVMREAIPYKGAVLTQISAYWFGRLEGLVPHHLISADAREIEQMVPALVGHRSSISGRAMLCRRTEVFPVECVVRGYISGSAWKEYSRTGTLAGEPLPKGLQESDQMAEVLFSPATKAETGHDENITIARMRALIGDAATELEARSRMIYERGRDIAKERGIIIADTKFEFGRTKDGQVLLIDEVLTPDSSRFWLASGYRPGGAQPSFDKQPLRDYLEGERKAGRWNGDAPAPRLPDDVVRETSARYLDAFARITGSPLDLAELS